MCTVTFVPFPDGDFVLTSNRDEAPDRNTLPPQPYVVNGVPLLFPKDEVAGGTWIGLSNKKRLICLLNGGFTAHKRAAAYKMSRGLIVTELLTAPNVIDTISMYDFKGIEPFTILLVLYETETQLYELVWDGNNAFFTKKSLGPYIWSSSLLYDSDSKQLRETWFSDFMQKTTKLTAKSLLKFHQDAGIGNPHTNLIMDKGFVKTKSITQVQKEGSSVRMHYHDLQAPSEIVSTL